MKRNWCNWQLQLLTVFLSACMEATWAHMPHVGLCSSCSVPWYTTSVRICYLFGSGRDRVPFHAFIPVWKWKESRRPSFPFAFTLLCGTHFLWNTLAPIVGHLPRCEGEMAVSLWWRHYIMHRVALWGSKVKCCFDLPHIKSKFVQYIKF